MFDNGIPLSIFIYVITNKALTKLAAVKMFYLLFQ